MSLTILVCVIDYVLFQEMLGPMDVEIGSVSEIRKAQAAEKAKKTHVVDGRLQLLNRREIG